MQNHLDTFNWPVIMVAAASWPWLSTLWELLPAPTALYMGLSALFMLFQMCDKLGLLERFKRKPQYEPEDY